MNLVNHTRYWLADIRGRGVYAGWPNEHRSIFIHVPKTAGTSVSHALGLSCPRHVPAKVFRQASPRKFASFFKFCFVRNPYDRLVSSYSFLRNGGMNADDARFASSHVSKFENFHHFVIEGLGRDPEIRNWVHFRPQTDFVCDQKTRILVDFVGRFEFISEDYRTVAKKLGATLELPITNRSVRSDYRDAYDVQTINVVRGIYSTDLETFGYGFD